MYLPTKGINWITSPYAKLRLLFTQATAANFNPQLKSSFEDSEKNTYSIDLNY